MTRILEVQVQVGDSVKSFTDPLALMWRHSLPMVAPGTEVRLTVRTERPDDVVLLMHHDRRLFLHPNGDNTYSGALVVPSENGVRHLGINALAHGTLFDDRERYSSKAWLWAYGVRTEPTP